MKEIFSKNFTLLALATLLASTGFMLLIPVLPLYALHSIGLDEGNIGLVVGVFSVSSLACRPFIGYVLDNCNRRIMLMAAITVFTMVLGSYALITTIGMLLFLRMLHGVSWAAITTSTPTIVADILPDHKRAEGIGYFSMVIPLAMVIGPVLGMELIAYLNSFPMVFFISSVLGILALAFIFLLKLPARKRPKSSFHFSFHTFYEKRSVGLAFMQFCYSFTYAGMVTFLPLFAYENKIENSGYFFMLYAIAILITRIVVRRTFDLRGPGMLILMGYLFFAAGALCLAFTHTSIMLFLSGALVGLGGGMIMPTINTMNMNIVDPSSRGKANATVFTAVDLGMGMGALILGYLIQHTSYQTTYIVGAIILTIPILWYFLLEKTRYFKWIEETQAKEV